MTLEDVDSLVKNIQKIPWLRWMESRSLDLSAMEIFIDEAIQAGEIIALYVFKRLLWKGVSEQLMHAAFVASIISLKFILWVLKIISEPLLSNNKK